MRKLFFSFLLIGLGGCVLSPPSSSLNPRNEDVSKGKRYFLRECGRCHDFIFPEERSAEQWQAILARKKGKVSLTATQYGQLKRYIMVKAGQ